MNYYGPKELAAAYRTVRNNTIAVAQDIPEDKYGFAPATGCRTVAQTLVHIAVSSRFPAQIHLVEHRSTVEGFDFMGFMAGMQAEERTPRTKQAIVDLLRAEGDKFAVQLESTTDSFLGEIVSFPPGMQPPTKTRFEMLMSAKEHEMHHRGQLMVVERMLNITPHLTRQMQERIAAMQAAQAQTAKA
jgi:uncharacterized damage-inducible protein DinB